MMVWSYEQHVQPNIDRMEREGRSERIRSPGDDFASKDAIGDQFVMAMLIPAGAVIIAMGTPIWGTAMAAVGVIATGVNIRSAWKERKAKPG